MTSLSVKCFFEESSSTCQYVVADSATKKCAIVDSVLFYDAAAGCTSPAPCDEMLAYIKGMCLLQTRCVRWFKATG